MDSNTTNSADSNEITVQGKTAQFAHLLERCRLARQKIPKKQGHDPIEALLSNLHFSDMIDALEVMFAERVKLEAVLKRTTPLETVDDLDIFEQYIVGLQRTSNVAKEEIQRLLSEGVKGESGAIFLDTEETGVQTLLVEDQKFEEKYYETLDRLSALKKEATFSSRQVAMLKDELAKAEERDQMRLREINLLKRELRPFDTSALDMEISRLRHELESQVSKESKLREELHVTVEERDNLARKLKELSLSKVEKTKPSDWSDKQIDSLKKTLAAAKEEVSRLKQELQDSRKLVINQEYLRNVFVSFLCVPEQRPHMLQVLVKLLDFNDGELERIKL